MVAIHGKQGSATFTSVTFEMQSFTIDATADTADSSIMDSTTPAAGTHWKDYVAGFKDWTATVEVLEVSGGAGLAVLGEEKNLVLDTVAGKPYGGTCICTGYSPSLDKDDAAKCTLTFQGTAQLFVT